MVPPGVRLGEVVPPEDPEDWTRPLTWVLAAGMVAAPVLAVAWFAVAPPEDPQSAKVGTTVLAIVAAAGAAVTGGLQRGAWRTFLTTLGAGMFAALGLVAVGTTVGGGSALATAFVAALAGVGGSAVAALVASLLAGGAGRVRRILSPAAIGGMMAVLLVQFLLSR
jgi:hypothetical protein